MKQDPLTTSRLSMQRIARALRPWAVGLLAIGIAGLWLANEWYADDACQTAAWKCELGTFGFTATIYVLPIGVALALIASAAWLIDLVSRRGGGRRGSGPTAER